MCNCLTFNNGGELKIKPTILLVVAYQYKRRGDSGFEAIGTMYSAVKQARFVKKELDCQHQAVWRLGLDNMVNVSELLINIVTIVKLKMLISFTKRYVDRISCCMLMICRCCSTGGKAEPKLSKVTYMKHGKPVFLLERGKEIVRNLKGMQVKESRKSESLVVMTGIGVETLPHSKEGRLLLGLWLRENLKNLCKEESK